MTWHLHDDPTVPPASADNHVDAGCSAPGGQPYILVADDMRVFREPVAAALRRHGFDTATASDGLEVMAQIRSRPPDLILLDLWMPNMDGLQVLRAMRDQKLADRTTVVILSGDTDKQRVAQAMALGAHSFINKSILGVESLLETIRLALAA